MEPPAYSLAERDRRWALARRLMAAEDVDGYRLGKNVIALRIEASWRRSPMPALTPKRSTASSPTETSLSPPNSL